jgi:CBS domain-containing membrane protein
MEKFGFHHLPIVDEAHKLVGLLSHGDLMHAVSSTLSANREARDELIRKRATVNQIMHREVIVVGPGDTVKKAGDLMLEHKIGCVPVVDEDNGLVGIVTRTDFLRLALEFLAGT